MKRITNGKCTDCGSSDIGEDGPNWWCNNCDRLMGALKAFFS